MVSPENTNWLYEYGFEDLPLPDCSFSAPGLGFYWPIQSSNDGLNISEGIDGTSGESSPRKENGKRARNESCAPSSKKAHREKLRRDRLNDKFVELGKVIDPGRLPKTDKLAILADAVRMVTQLQGEAQKLKQSNLKIQEKIKELKDEKNELRNEKQTLKLEKEKLEQQMKMLSVPQPAFLSAPPSIPAAFAARSQASTTKVVPVISYPGVAMWQFVTPTAVDTSQDHLLRPPVA